VLLYASVHYILEVAVPAQMWQGVSRVPDADVPGISGASPTSAGRTPDYRLTGRYQPHACGPITVAVSVRGQHLPKSPFRLNIAAGAAYAPNCRLHDRRPIGTAQAPAMRRLKLPVQAHDRAHNRCTTGGFVCAVAFSYSGGGGEEGGREQERVAGSWEDLGDGLYNARIVLPRAGHGELAITSAADGTHVAGAYARAILDPLTGCGPLRVCVRVRLRA
jgi:hypothetical protein